MPSSNEKRWDSLRRSLRICHEAIDAGLLELQNISQVMFIVSSSSSSSSGKEEDASSGKQLATTRRTIQEVLRQANQITDEMAGVTDQDPVRKAQLSRMEAVTSNYLQEFQQTTQNIEQKIERRKLMSKTAVIGQTRSDLESGHAAEQQQLLREKGAISSSLDMLSNTIEQGKDILSSLARQQNRFASAAKSLQQFTHRFPVLRNLMSRIHRSKLKQTIVLAFVVACCLLFLLWYSFG